MTDKNPAKELIDYLSDLSTEERIETVQNTAALTGFTVSEIVQSGDQMSEVVLNCLKSENPEDELSDKFYGDYLAE